MNRRHHMLVLVAIALALIVAPPLYAPIARAQEEDYAAAVEWCTSHNGTVVERYPASNTASDAPVTMGPPVAFCEFTGGDGADPPESSISIRLTTLTSDQPSMAATAYLTKPEMTESGGSANAASVYCDDLGGAEIGGVLAPSGGWVNVTDATDILDGLCVFPDLSIIDSWGLAYHTIGTIRGADLEPLFRWKPESSG
jgi:putative hemolysin